MEGASANAEDAAVGRPMTAAAVAAEAAGTDPHVGAPPGGLSRRVMELQAPRTGRRRPPRRPLRQPTTLGGAPPIGDLPPPQP